MRKIAENDLKDEFLDKFIIFLERHCKKEKKKKKRKVNKLKSGHINGPE